MSGGQIQAPPGFATSTVGFALVAKYGPSWAAAERALKIELANRQTPGGSGAIVAATHVPDLAQLWLDAPHGWSTGTERTYRSVIRNQVVPALGALEWH